MERVTFSDFADEVFGSAAIGINDSTIELTNAGEADEHDAGCGTEIGSLMIYTDAFGTIVIAPSAQIDFLPIHRTYRVQAAKGPNEADEEVFISLFVKK